MVIGSIDCFWMSKLQVIVTTIICWGTGVRGDRVQISCSQLSWWGVFQSMLLPTALSFMYQSIHISTPPLFFILRFTAIKNSTDLWVNIFLVHTPNLQRYRLTRGGNNISDSSLEGKYKYREIVMQSWSFFQITYDCSF